ncbi:MAG: aldehyde dehydrogenase family protein, partial [Longimicrobiales bacterium]
SVVEGVVDAIWFNQGQVCCAGSRILAQEGVSDRLVEKLKARMETLRIGDPLDKGVDIGAIIAPVQLEKIERLVAQGREEGAAMWQPSWSCPEEGCFYPPTLFTDVAPAATIAQVEIFGPVVVLMTFRTPEEAVQLANNTRYGLAASVWTESVNLALDIAPKIKAGTVWVNCTNVFDAASGFGGYRESGFGREGGREGLFEYLTPTWAEAGGGGGERGGGGTAGGAGAATESGFAANADSGVGSASATPPRPPIDPPVDRTAKLYIGGKQARPDQGYSMEIHTPAGVRPTELVPRGNRKDVRDAVEAAHAAQPGWARATAHARAQVLYYIGENLAARADELASRIVAMTGGPGDVARDEVEASIRRTWSYAAYADKWDGRVHHTPFRNVTLAMPEPIGVVGVLAPDEPSLLGFLSAVLPPIATGNAVVAVPSEPMPLAATDLYQVLDTSDLPGGVLNIVTGRRTELAEVLAAHDDVDAVWSFGPPAGCEAVERLSAGNMKRTWCIDGGRRDWADARQGEGEEFLRHATQVKNIWVPYGE